MSNKFKITNEDETSKLKLDNVNHSNFFIQEESDSGASGAGGVETSEGSPTGTTRLFEPPMRQPSSVQSDTVSVGATESLPDAEPEQEQRHRFAAEPSVSHRFAAEPSVSHRFAAEPSVSNSFLKPKRNQTLRQQNFKNTAEQYGLYMNPEKHKPFSQMKQNAEESDAEEIQRNSSFDSGYKSSSSARSVRSVRSERSVQRSVRSERSERSERSSRVLGRKSKKRSEREREFRKKELLRELQELESKGFILYNDYSIRSKLEDLENEVKLGKRYFEVSSLKILGKNTIFNIVRLIEQSTLIFNPLNLKLDGLYTQILSSKDSIEHEIGAIVKKWVGDEDGVFPPEIKLLGILLSITFSTHLSNQIAKSLTNPETLNQVNPNILNNLLSFGTSFLSGGSSTPSQPVPSNDIRPPPQTSSDIDNLFSRLMPQNVPPINPNPMVSSSMMMPPQSTRQVDNIEIDDSKRFFDASSVSDQSTLSDIGGESVITINTNNQKKKRGRKKSNKKSLKIF